MEDEGGAGLSCGEIGCARAVCRIHWDWISTPPMRLVSGIPVLFLSVHTRLSTVRCVPLFLLLTLLPVGCRTTAPSMSADEANELRARVDELQEQADSLARAAELRHYNLHSTLWTQTSVEYTGVARQAYELATMQLGRALEDSTWTAALEQADQSPAEYRDKPPAVVLDVDETVLDNSAYQARLVLDDASYSSESWKSWVREEAAGAVPGARSFTQAAVEKGVQVIYLTNRDADVEAPTRDNLQALGFPVDDAPDAVLTQYEKDGWGPKEARREWVAERYRILLLVGDNFGDFASEVDTTVSARREKSRDHRDLWGTGWIVLPNAQYGSWEGALYDFNYGLPPLRQLEEKHRQLNPKR